MNLGSQGCHNEKVINKTTWIWTQATPASQASILPLDPSKPIQNVPTNLSMSRSQLREQICQTRKSYRQEWQSLVVLNGTNIFLNGTNISLLKFICGILNQGVANSLWNHVIQISSGQIYSIFRIYIPICEKYFGNIYSFKSNTYLCREGFLLLPCNN